MKIKTGIKNSLRILYKEIGGLIIVRVPIHYCTFIKLQSDCNNCQLNGKTLNGSGSRNTPYKESGHYVPLILHSKG